MMCQVLEVSRSSYYIWKKNPQGKRAIRTREIGKKIQGIYFEAKGRYGSPRITKELEEQGMKLSRRTVAKYMKQMGLKAGFHVNIKQPQTLLIRNLWQRI